MPRAGRVHQTKKRAIAAPERISMRLVQQVPPGTLGAYQDSIFGYWWTTRASRGLNGTGGFQQVEIDPVLGDSSQMTVQLPPVGSDGINNQDRLYYYAGTPNPQYASPGTLQGGSINYMPGDEWIELRRGTSDLVQVGTPVSEQSQQDQLQLVCRDVTAIFKKTRETAAGFWQNSPRDVFEHYSRAWQTIVADDFNDSTQFPNRNSDTFFGTPNGRFEYVRVSAAQSSVVTLAPTNTTGQSFIYSQASVTDAGPVDHSCWRVEVSIPNVSLVTGGGYTPVISLGMFSRATGVSDGSQMVSQVIAGGNRAMGVCEMSISPTLGQVAIQTVGYSSGFTGASGFYQDSWPVNLVGLLDANNRVAPPYTLAIEARERWIYYYLNGQLIGLSPRPYADPISPGSTPLSPYVLLYGGTGSTMDVDYFVLRKTTPPMNGGQVGDYALPSPPSPGGLQGAYYDTTPALYPPITNANGTIAPTNYASRCAAMVTGKTPVVVRTDPGIVNAVTHATTPGWFPTQLSAAQSAFIRWTGSIYLQLATTDYWFRMTGVSTSTGLSETLWIGKTRAGEALLHGAGQSEVQPMPQGTWTYTEERSWIAETPFTGGGAPYLRGSTRAFLGTSQTGWYPLIFEFAWYPIDPTSGTWSTGFEYSTDSGTTWLQPTPYMLSPYGCFTEQVPSGDGHFDVLQTTIGQAFAYQWKSTPAPLESGNFPGYVVPKIRVGRDVDLQLTEENATNPQESSTAEDNATSDLAQAQGLGGNNSGNLTAQAYNFAVIGGHPFDLLESENLPATTEMALLITQLATLLGLRSNVFQSFLSDTTADRSMQDLWPLSGALAEFDWQPGDGLRINLPMLGVVDVTPRQIQALKRVYYQDGMGQNNATFKPRPRDFAYTMRRFIRQVYQERRAFQGQLVNQPGTQAVAPATSMAPLPADLRLVRSATLTVLAKSDKTTPFFVYVNGVAIGTTIYGTGVYDISNYVSRNQAVEPQMLVSLVNASTTVDCQTSYMLSLLILVPKI